MNRVDTLLEYLQISPHDSFLKHALALEYIKAGNDDEAAKVFDALLKHEPGYVGSYYHYAKLLERKADVTKAVNIYTKGMEIAKAERDTHAYNELFMAYEDLQDSLT